MIPGLAIYRAIVGTVQIARQAGAADPQTVAETLGNATNGCVVVGGLTLGLIVGARLMQVLAGSRDSPTSCQSAAVAIIVAVET